MEKFVHDENLKRFRNLLDKVTNEEQRKQILHLLAEEEARVGPIKLALLRE